MRLGVLLTDVLAANSNSFWRSYFFRLSIIEYKNNLVQSSFSVVVVESVIVKDYVISWLVLSGWCYMLLVDIFSQKVIFLQYLMFRLAIIVL